jgi:acyl dehydratase
MHDDPELIGHRTVTSDAVATFGGLTGDYSRIHFDHALGAASPHGRGFAHGLLSASWALGAMALYSPERLGCGEAGAYVSSFSTRFHHPVHFGETLAIRCGDVEPDTTASSGKQRRSKFSVLSGAGQEVTTGAVDVRILEPTQPREPLPTEVSAQEPWPAGRYEASLGVSPMMAEDVLDHGPRGGARVRTVTETDVVNFVDFTGELNPLYLDAGFAERALFGERIAPPMLCFCLGFSVWLRELLRLPLGGSESSAGHLGDRWHFVAPVRIGDSLEVRYQPLSLRRTRSQPTRGIATFGLQLLNQHQQVVQQGEVDMMLAMRPPQ